jgi:hypothetical protein
LLTENQNAILFYAGNGDIRPIEKFINKNKFKKRIYLLAERKDINELFKKCDIYLGTYPYAGGLMSQYAAINGKPILAYSSSQLSGNFVEGIVCHHEIQQITYTDLDDFFAEAKKLCADKEYREQKGTELQKCVITSKEFEKRLYDILYRNYIDKFNKITIDYDKIYDLYLEVENKYQDEFKILLARTYKYRMFLIFPIVAFKTVSSLLYYILLKKQ